MKNFYLVYGNERTIVKNKVDNIISEIGSMDVVKYSYDDALVDDVILDAYTLSMFSPNKVIVIDNCDFFSGSKSKASLEKFEDYFKNFNTNTYIIFICYSDKIDSRKKIVSFIKNNGNVIEIKKDDSKYVCDYITNILDKNNFKMEDLNYFISKVGINLDNISNELDKLMIYKANSNYICNEDIDLLVISNYDNEIYEFTDAIFKRDVNRALSLMNEFLNKSFDEIGLISLVSNHFMFLLQVKLLVNKNKGYQEIGSILGVNPYRVKFTLSNLYYYSVDMLISYINRLFEIDKDIKLGKINKTIALEMFIISSCSDMEI